MHKFLCLLIGLFFIWAPDAYSAEEVGKAVVRNTVIGTLEGNRRLLQTGDSIHDKEDIKTGYRSFSQLMLNDQTIIAMGPDSHVTLQKYLFDPATFSGQLLLTLTDGVYRFVTGNLPKDNYVIQTATATIQANGTVFDVVVENEGETAVILRNGAVSLTNKIGAVQLINTPGFASIVASARTAPTLPAPPPPRISAKVESISEEEGGEENLIEPPDTVIETQAITEIVDDPCGSHGTHSHGTHC